MIGSERTTRVRDTDVLERTARIQALKDGLRRYAHSGVICITAGLRRKPDESRLDAFSNDNDPYAEHDFGAFRAAGKRLFWKIDYYDRSRRYGSPDPADPAVTCRVLTIMLTSEY